MSGALVLGAQVQLTSSTYVYDPIRGNELRQTYRGSLDGCRAIAAAFSITGHRAEFINDGGGGIANIYFGNFNDGQAELPVDSWTIDKDFYNASIWSHPYIISIAISAKAALKTFRPNITGTLTDDDSVATLRTVCENGLKGSKWDGSKYTATNTGIVPPTSVGLSLDALKVYQLLLRADENFEVERCIVKRIRTYSIFYTTRVVIPPIPQVYTTAQLKSVFGLPDGIIAQLPSSPGSQFTPSDTTWAWKLRANSERINWIGRVEETSEFVFAAWSNLLYTNAT